MFRFPLLMAFVLNAFAVGAANDDTARAEAGITAEDLLRHIKVLSSDAFEGRAPATKGEELSVKYITDQFRRAGAKPGNPDGTFVQRVPLVGSTASNVQVIFRAGERQMTPPFPQESV